MTTAFFLLAFAGAVSAPAADTTPAASGIIPAETIVVLELVDTVSSKIQVRGDHFALRLAEPIVSGDRILVPVGTPATGEVIHAQKASGGGRAGELILAARYLETPRGRIRLHSSVGSVGQNHTQAALATSFIAGPFALMVRGSDRVLPAGSLVSSKTAVDADLTHLPGPDAATTASASTASNATPATPVTPSMPNPEGNHDQ